jgi:AcrR family transcriptional regulator
MATRDTAAPRRERADARRNRERVLAAARAVFAEQGPDAALEEIARRAEVGIGTLYRHFPNRQALVDAVFVESVTHLCDQAQTLLADESPFDALRDWMRAQLTHAATYGALGATTMLPIDDQERTTSCQLMHASLQTLLARAQGTGAVRADVDADDVMRLVGAIALASDDSPEGCDRAGRLFTLMMDGLRAG